MHRIDHATRVVNGNGAGKDGFTGGDQSASIPPTHVTPAWLNAQQEEIANAVEVAGITLDKTSNGQLAQSFEVRLENMALANHFEIEPAGINALAGAFAPVGGVLGVGYGLWGFVGGYGAIMHSSNGQTWYTASPDLAYAGNFQGLHYADGLWVAVGAAGEIQTSPDMTNWTHRNRAGAFNGDFHGVTKANGLWVIVGTSGEIQTSPDAIVWTHRNAAGGAVGTFHAVAHGNGYFVAISPSQTQRSADGLTWVDCPSDPAVGFCLVFGVGLFVAAGGSGIKTSTDGLLWTLRTPTPLERGLTRSASQFIAVGDNGHIATSPNGIDWRYMIRDAFAGTVFGAVVAGSGMVAFTTDTGSIRRSLYI